MSAPREGCTATVIPNSSACACRSLSISSDFLPVFDTPYESQSCLRSGTCRYVARGQ